MVESFGLEVKRSRPDWMMGEGLLELLDLAMFDFDEVSAEFDLLEPASLVLKSL